MNEEEASLFDMLWLLLASVVFVLLFQKIPGGSEFKFGDSLINLHSSLISNIVGVVV